ncbi:MAG: UDP-N-acetylglucosamine 1-carboxyvinyltransferase [Mariprofundaceae bacterium]|nr:UDP-N-acetylglucosamine 1-carboxyvinyltransferase [Mariprofundaceae bacterium]
MSEQLIIHGGKTLHGSIEASGAKNAALPLLAAAILTSEELLFHRIPHLKDVSTMLSLLVHQGADVSINEGNQVTVCTASLTKSEASYELVKTMRASSLVLGPLLTRFGHAYVSLPGGCAIGARPIDLHLKALEKMGATIHMEHGYVKAIAENGLHGAHIHFDHVTVTGTENIMMAAVLAKGETILENSAREPEVVNLAETLIMMGAKIEGAGTDRICIQGVETLHGGDVHIIADRIETATYLAAGLITGGDVTVTDTDPHMLEAFLARVEEAGAMVKTGQDWIRCASDKPLQAMSIHTTPHPGFPTDLQAQFMALMCCAQGSSVITENIFENRFMHVQELLRMGAHIELDGHSAIVHGGKPLSGAPVMATDLRASACLILAALAAQGTTHISRIYHLDRGYERIEEKLMSLGASIQRISQSSSTGEEY